MGRFPGEAGAFEDCVDILAVEFFDDGSTDVCYCFVQAGREAGPVVKVDDVYRPVGRYDGIAPIDTHSQLAGSLDAEVLQIGFFECILGGSPVDAFVPEFVAPTLPWIAPEEKGLVCNAVEFYQVARQMLVYDYPFYASHGESGPMFSGNICGRGKTYVIGVEGVHVGPF